MLLSKGGQTDCASEADPLARVLNTSCARPITVLNGSCQACVMPGAVPGPRGGARMQARHGLFISDIFFFLFSVKKIGPKGPKQPNNQKKHTIDRDKRTMPGWPVYQTCSAVLGPRGETHRPGRYSLFINVPLWAVLCQAR